LLYVKVIEISSN